jgi:hypothetical protein
MIDNIL